MTDQKLTTRRHLLKKTSLLAAAVLTPNLPKLLAANPNNPQPNRPFYWAYLIHLSYNMWCDWQNPQVIKKSKHAVYQPYLRFDEKLYNQICEKMVAAKMNMIVLDLGDAVKYDSHPEIAVKNAWSVKKLKNEVTKLKQMGLEPIPKLNFSAKHDAWLGPYGKVLSTEKYYQVCKELIQEVLEIFDTPPYFHLGFDEEDERMQSTYKYAVARQNSLWWHDLYFLADYPIVAGSTPWIWSDFLRTPNEYRWRRPEDFRNMPKEILQSNWYYGTNFDTDEKGYLLPYKKLEQLGYDQFPCGSNYLNDENFALTVKYCKKIIAPERLKGFLTAPWKPTLPEFKTQHLQAIDQVAAEIKNYSSKSL